MGVRGYGLASFRGSSGAHLTQKKNFLTQIPFDSTYRWVWSCCVHRLAFDTCLGPKDKLTPRNGKRIEEQVGIILLGSQRTLCALPRFLIYENKIFVSKCTQQPL